MLKEKIAADGERVGHSTRDHFLPGADEQNRHQRTVRTLANLLGDGHTGAAAFGELDEHQLGRGARKIIDRGGAQLRSCARHSARP